MEAREATSERHAPWQNAAAHPTASAIWAYARDRPDLMAAILRAAVSERFLRLRIVDEK